MVAGLNSPKFDTEFKKSVMRIFLMTLILVQAQIRIQIRIHA